MKKKWEGLKKGVKEFVNEGVSELVEKPQFYKDVDRLISELDAVVKDKTLQKDQESAPALEAARQLKFTLEQAKNKFDVATKEVHGLLGEGMNRVAYNNAFYDFAKTSVTAIHQHQPTLMAAPGIWNQIKAAINNVLESWFDVKDALETKVSKVGMYGDFKNRFDTVKDEGKEKVEDIENKPLGLH